MRRFDYEDNEEFREEVDKFFEEVDPVEELVEEQAMQEAQLKFVQRDLNIRVLRTAIRLCEKSFWWRFLSLHTRIKKVEYIYRKLRKLEEE